MNWYRLVPLAAAGLLALASAPARAQETKIGVFDAQRITQETAEGARIQARLNSLKDRKRQDLEKVQQELEKLRQEFTNTAISLSEDKRKELGLKIDRKQIELEGMEKQATRELQMEAEQAQESWQRQVLEAVAAFGKQNGFTLILPVEVVGYYSQAVDVTEQLIKTVDAAKPAAPPAPAAAPQQGNPPAAGAPKK
ncbi:MAG: OmpH family outer membrane protein [Acidobacteria bacterium]|nr:OmpH family outer membrane protein [Acidobacteriota bacterium]